MATESPLRLIGSNQAGNWPVNKDSAIFSTTSSNLVADELGLLLEGHRYHGSRNITGPSRSGSAPPSMEGSRAAFDLLKGQLTANSDASFEHLTNATQSCTSEEQLRAHPAYLAYYCANVNLNPRLPPPLVSRENRHLVHRISGSGDYRKVSSFDDSSKLSQTISRSALSTHKEEPEDEKSPRTETSDSMEKHGRHKSLVDLIQADFPRTPSPVYNSHSRSTCHLAAEQAIPDTFQSPVHDSSVNTTKPQSRTSTVSVNAFIPNPGVHSVGSKSNADFTPVQVACSTLSHKTLSSHSGYKANSSRDSNNLLSSVCPSDEACQNLGVVENEMNNLMISSDDHKSQHVKQPPQQVVLNTRGSSSQAHTVQPQLIPQGLQPQGLQLSQSTAEHVSYGQMKLSSAEMQPVLQTTAIAAPFYGTAAAYGTPYYSNLQNPTVFSPQFGMSGYTLSTSIVPPVITGYPPNHTAIPVTIENPVTPNFNARASGVSGGSLVPGVDMQQFYKLYGHLGVAIQPSFPDQLYLPYFQHPSMDPYAAAAQYDSMISRGSTIFTPPGSFDPQKSPAPSTYISDQRPQGPRVGGVNVLNVRKGGSATPNYHGSPPSLGVLTQYPNSPMISPAFQGSPSAGSSFSGRRNENVKFPFGSGRSAGLGWQVQRGHEKVEDPKAYSFLEELKSNKARRFELSDIAGRIVEFSADQHGSRFIQQKLETCTAEEKASVFMEVLPHASTLMTDVFGNYVIQKFFEHGSPEQRKELANKLVDNILHLSLQMYGCRVIQKALEVIELDQKTQLVKELDGNVMRCVRDQNGNHVIQKCIECVPTEKIGFIISAFRGQVATLSMHPYGCRVIQRVLEHCTDESQSQCIVDEILQSACILAQDQYGNYVTQHVLERGKPHERSQIINKLAGQVVRMSQHKFASNVVEKCLVYGDTSEKEQLIEEIVGQTDGNDNLLIMMKDQFANYVVQKILETCTDRQREILINRIKVHSQALKKYTYGKHIVARIEQLYDEDTHSSELTSSEGP